MIEQVQRPTLIIEPNKSLAAQLSSELRELFPKNRVEFFVSYYDYYQPEAYLPTTDTYIEKDSSINDEIDRLRHATHLLAAHAARRHRGGLGLVHLRPGLARRVPGPDPRPGGGGAGRPARHAAPPRRPAVRPQRREPGARHLPGPGRHRRDPPGLRGGGAAGRVVRRHRRAHRPLRRADRRDGRGDGGRRRLRRHPLRDRRRHHPAGRRLHRGGAARAAPGVREGGQAARGAAPPGAHRARPRDAGRDRRVLGHRELQPAPRRPGTRARRPTRCSTSSPRTTSA